eukprot:GFYU01000070.1.p2 GENE.GFYU01000070.1~~GFYU01000070.1.p2  ORF type:complete len:501 (+),score=165.87 GFYU01000070.1:166-1668(+)
MIDVVTSLASAATLEGAMMVVATVAACILVTMIPDCLQDKRVNTPGCSQWNHVGATIVALWNYTRIYDWLLEQTIKYGGTWRFHILSQPAYTCITDPTNVEHMLKTNFENYEKSDEFRSRMHELLGHGIFAADGAQWKTQRKTASHIFNVGNFRDNMCDVFARNGTVLVNRLENVKEGEFIDMQDLFFRYTLDSIAEIAFGVTLGSLSKDDVPFARAFDGAQLATNMRFFFPCWQLLKFFSPDEYRLRQGVAVMNDFAAAVIKARRAENMDTVRTKKDLLSLFLARKDENGEAFSDEYLRDLIMNFMIAGRDTTAIALSWALFETSRSERVEQKLLEEFASLNGSRTYDEIKALPYSEAVITETLRLYPSVPKDGKLAVDDDVLPDGSFVPKGTWLVYVPYVMGRLEKNWPDQPLEFKPERFIKEDGSCDKPSPYLFTAFQAGPRTCLGQTMAYVEAKTVLATILPRFKFALKPGHNVTYVNSLVMPMRYGLPMSVEKRA